MERRLDKQSVLRARGYSRVIDLSAAEKDGRHFEGTGALVLDRINGVAYVALSERADPALAEHWVDRLGYKVVPACTCPESRSCAPSQVCKWRVLFNTKVGAAVDIHSVAGPGDLPLKRPAWQARLPHQRAHGYRH